MYFDFEGKNFDSPTIESAISWRDQVLISVFVHLLILLLIVLFPRLPFVQEAVERRLDKLAEIAELETQALAQQRVDDGQRFVFVQPRVELEPSVEPPPEAMPSDRDRIAESLLRTLDQDSRLPIVEGNSTEFILDDDPNDSLSPEEKDGLEDGIDRNNLDTGLRFSETSVGQGDSVSETELSDNPVAVLEEAGDLALADLSMTGRELDPADFRNSDEARLDIRQNGLFEEFVESFRQLERRETFRNLSGDTGRFGPDIQFDTKGVEFGPWLRRFVAQIRRNWFVPYAIWSEHGNVIITFNVHRDGLLADLTVAKPARVEAFTNSAFNALRALKTTQPLPSEYPDAQAFFTVTFYFNESSPGR